MYGGATRSLFPKCKALLKADKTRCELVLEFGNDQEFTDYESLMDYLVCSLFPQFKEPCLRYYKTRKDSLDHFLHNGEAEIMDDALVVAVELLYAGHVNNLRITAPQLRVYIQEVSR